MANFEAVRWNFSSSTNSEIGRSESRVVLRFSSSFPSRRVLHDQHFELCFVWDLDKSQKLKYVGYLGCMEHCLYTLLPISEFVLDEKFQRNDSKFAIPILYIRKPKVVFFVFHFVQLYVFT